MGRDGAGLQFADDLLEDRPEPAARELRQEVALGDGLEVDELREMGPLAEVLHHRAHDLVGGRAGIGRGGELGEHGAEGADAALEHRLVERVLARVVVVEGGAVHLGRGGDLAHAGAGQAAAREDDLGGVEDACLGGDRRFRLGRRHFRIHIKLQELGSSQGTTCEGSSAVRTNV